jgi:hypothetical protein
MRKIELPIDYNRSHWKIRKQARNQYVEMQEGRCHHCGTPLDCEPAEKITMYRIDWSLFPPQFLKHPIHLHHDHETGLTIGAVHAYCNAVLWQYHGK